MNLLDATVLEVLGPPVTEYGKLIVHVRYDCEGIEGTTTIMCDNQEQLALVKPGFEFLT